MAKPFSIQVLRFVLLATLLVQVALRLRWRAVLTLLHQPLRAQRCLLWLQ